jgi:hypothetical protein
MRAVCWEGKETIQVETVPVRPLGRRQDAIAWAPMRLPDGHHRSVRNVTE